MQASGRPTLPGVFSALPDFALAAAYLITWLLPYTFGTRMVSHLMQVMLLEFIVIHSAAFMGQVALAPEGRTWRTKRMAGLAVFYSLFALGWSLAFRTWWPLLAFWGLVFNRLAGVLFGQAATGSEKQFIRAGWAAAALSYLLCVMLTTLLPIPRLGITASVVSAQDLPGSGIWIDDPQRVIAFGFLYFALLGFSELYGHRVFLAGVRTKGTRKP